MVVQIAKSGGLRGKIGKSRATFWGNRAASKVICGENLGKLDAIDVN